MCRIFQDSHRPKTRLFELHQGLLLQVPKPRARNLISIFKLIKCFFMVQKLMLGIVLIVSFFWLVFSLFQNILKRFMTKDATLVVVFRGK